MIIRRFSLVLSLALSLAGCALIDDSAPKKSESTGLIATPPSYYSTPKARYLGTRYKDNLDRLVERITRNPKTSSLQFANNISSVGGIGFFTHSATRTADERYLEVVLATPETFEVKGDFSDKVQQLFSRYGTELLGIVTADNEIYQDREMSGYGLNLAWRNVLSEPTGSRVTLERAVIYVPKGLAHKFLLQQIPQQKLLADAVIFAVEEDGPLNLVSYHPRETQPDVRAAISEDNLPDSPGAAKAVGRAAEPGKGVQAPVATFKSASEIQKTATQPLPQGSATAKLPAGLPEATKTETGSPQKPAPTEIANSSLSSRVAAGDVPPVKESKAMSAGPTVLAPEKSGEPLAMLNKSSAVEVFPPKPASVRSSPKALEGFIIQLAFNDKDKAQRWAESMEKRGFAVSVTEAGTEGALRVRLGNFNAREEAERQLRTLKQDGLSGIVINLPQAFRPLARTSIP